MEECSMQVMFSIAIFNIFLEIKKLGVKSILKFNLNSRDFYAWHVVVVFVFCQTVPVMGL